MQKFKTYFKNSAVDLPAFAVSTDICRKNRQQVRV